VTMREKRQHPEEPCEKGTLPEGFMEGQERKARNLGRKRQSSNTSFRGAPIIDIVFKRKGKGNKRSAGLRRGKPRMCRVFLRPRVRLISRKRTIGTRQSGRKRGEGGRFGLQGVLVLVPKVQVGVKETAPLRRRGAAITIVRKGGGGNRCLRGSRSELRPGLEEPPSREGKARSFCWSCTSMF